MVGIDEAQPVTKTAIVPESSTAIVRYSMERTPFFPNFPSNNPLHSRGRRLKKISIFRTK